MNRNKNKITASTSIKTGEKVIEKYNDSNSNFIRILLTVPEDGVVTFSKFTVFENYSYIYWGDGTKGKDYSHTYTVESGLRGKDINIIIADVTEMAGCYFDTGTARNTTKEMYFGKGVRLNPDSSPGDPSSLKKLLNISNATKYMLTFFLPNGGPPKIEEITLNPDCLIVEEECFRDLSTTIEYLDCSNVLLFEKNCFLHTTIETIVLGKNFIEPEIWGGTDFVKCFYEGSEEDYNNNNYNVGIYGEGLYYYSEEEPFDDGNYWHWVKGKPVIWE